MFYGIQQSTDLRCPGTIVAKFRNKKQLEKWMKVSGNFTYSNPGEARNFHHDLRYGYELKGRINKKDSVFKTCGTNTYPENNKDRMANYLYKHGDKV